MKKVLIVDDDDGFREALSTLLEMEGYEVDVAPNGREGLARLKSASPPNIVLLDLMMPEMSGWELISAMKQDPELARIPAAVVSAARGPTLPRSVRVFSKPFATSELLDYLGSTT